LLPLLAGHREEDPVPAAKNFTGSALVCDRGAASRPRQADRRPGSAGCSFRVQRRGRPEPRRLPPPDAAFASAAFASPV